VVARHRERFGGIKVGSAFFGWLTATGMSVLLIALLTAGGVAFGVATNTTVNVDQAVQESEQGTGTAQTVGLVGAITLLVVLLIAYYCGGYVAGRMARFNGAKQGLAVWLWGVLMALVIAAVAAVAGAQYNVFAQLNLPRLPVNEGQVTAVGAIAIGAAILAALVGAVLGGMAGMRFHRNVDQAGLEPRNDHTT
jgi:heme/copper-type cytochrome/quinol oxidase subunit 2